jgi:hypothetical protein
MKAQIRKSITIAATLKTAATLKDRGDALRPALARVWKRAT